MHGGWICFGTYVAGLVSLVRTSPMHLLCTTAAKRPVQMVASGGGFSAAATTASSARQAPASSWLRCGDDGVEVLVVVLLLVTMAIDEVHVLVVAKNRRQRCKAPGRLHSGAGRRRQRSIDTATQRCRPPSYSWWLPPSPAV
jgi:hypothetical protein